MCNIHDNQNACGTVGLLHALMNAGDDVEKEGWLKKFDDNTKGKDAEGRATVLEGDTEVHLDASESRGPVGLSCLSAKEPYVYPQKSPIYPQKSPIYPQKSPIYSQKSPIYPQKSAVEIFLQLYCAL